MISTEFARDQLMRLSGLPYFEKLESVVFGEMVSTLRAAMSEEICRKTVDNLQYDLAERPTVGQIRRALMALNDSESGPSEHGGYCGKLVEGWTYLSHDPEAPVTRAEENRQEEIPKYLLPSRCVRGWIHRTIWKAVVPERIDEEGNPIRQPYEFAGRCKCQPGGVI